MEPGWVPEWEPGWELEWEPDWEAGWEPDWEPGWKPEWEPNWDQTGTKLAPNEGPLEGPWGSLGASLELPGRTRGGPQGSGAPMGHRGPKKRLKCVTVAKTSWGKTVPARCGRRFWVPPGDSLKDPIRTLSCTNC